MSKHREIQGTPAPLAWTTLCHICDKTFISLLRKFTVPYICGDCEKEVGLTVYPEDAERPRCPYGHPLWGANMYIARGIPQCRFCKTKKARATRNLGVHSGD